MCILYQNYLAHVYHFQIFHVNLEEKRVNFSRKQIEARTHFKICAFQRKTYSKRISKKWLIQEKGNNFSLRENWIFRS
jgi:hypothetical protein